MSKPSDPMGTPATSEELETYRDIGFRLAAQLAEDNFRSLTADPGWTRAEVEAETDQAIARMETTARGKLAGRASDPDGRQWQQVWQEMERRYRERMGELLGEAGPRGGGTAQ